jgi:hypothetical protein
VLRLVHVSDIHFRHAPGWDLDADQRDQLLVDLAGLLKQEEAGVNGILVGGDIAFSAHPDQYSDAKDWLERMIEISDCPPSSVWMVPGNHDIDRQVIERSSICGEFQASVKSCGSEDLDSFLNRRMAVDPAGSGLLTPLHQYNAFAKDWFCATKASKLEWHDPLGSLDGIPVILSGLNSAFVSSEDDAGDDEDPNLILGSQQCKLPEKLGAIHFVLCHHPPKRLRDWTKVEPYLRRAHFLLFGHEHKFSLEQSNPEGQVRINAGAVVPEKDGQRLATYNLLRLHLDGERIVLDVQRRIWSETDKRFVGANNGPEVRLIARDLRSLNASQMPGEAAEPEEVQEAVESEEPPPTPFEARPATPLAAADSEVETVTIDQQARLRQIAVSFMNAPLTKRLEIARRLSVLDDADLELDSEEERDTAILTKIRDRGLIDQLAEELGI